MPVTLEDLGLDQLLVVHPGGCRYDVGKRISAAGPCDLDEALRRRRIAD